MAFDKAKQSFAAIEERFRRLYNLAGQIGTTFTPAITPVLIAGDIRDPGTATFKGRKWAWVSEEQNVLASSFNALYTPVDLIIRGVACWAAAAANNRASAHIVAPGTTFTGFSVTRNAGTWIENRSTPTDLPPFQDRPQPVAATLASQELNRFAYWNFAAVAQNVIPVTMHVVAGSYVAFNCGNMATASYAFGLWGEVL